LKAELVSPARCSVSMAYRAKASYEQHLKPGVTTETELKRTTLTEILPKNFNAKKYSPLHKTPHRPSAWSCKVWPISTARMEDSTLEAERNSQGTSCVP